VFKNSRGLAPLLLTSALVLAACGGGDESSDDVTPSDPSSSPATADWEPLTIYSGRSETLVAPVIEQFTDATGIEVEVRYADSAQLASQLIEEGERSPADVFFAQDAGALGAVTNAELAGSLEQEVLDLVPQQYQADDGTWVGVTGRARVVVYDPRQVSEQDVPTSVDDLTAPEWSEQVGLAPTNASFQSFVTGYRVAEGDDAAQAWLQGMVDNDAQVFEGNTPILDGVDNGVVAAGLINHYYWYRKVAEVGEQEVPSRLAFLTDGDPGALVNVAGVQTLAGTDQPEQAAAFVAFLLSDEAQTYFAAETFEYPLVSTVEPAADLPALDSIEGPDIDLSDLDSLGETIAMLEEVGLL
jgi:iron(III) transport system substrate-binding protein